MQPAIAPLGPRRGNFYVEALAELARRHRGWLRPLPQWRPDAQDPRRQFASLARYLLARYELPLFMDAAWCRGRGALAQRQQAWFLHMAGGGNIRTAHLPLELTKRMAHHFSAAPADNTIEQALRWAQIVGQGGGGELVEAILATPLGTSFDNEVFWATVVTWWVKHPDLDAQWVAPVYDFIQYRKFEPREIALPGGDVRIETPPEPNFSMKSRSVPKLMEAIDAWHVQLAREAKAALVSGWPRMNVPDFEHVERDPDTGQVTRWHIAQLCTHKELFTEGREMRHCASSYARHCRAGKQSIWSLQVTDEQSSDRRLATIALDPRTRLITQLRGRLNLTANNIRRGKGGLDTVYADYVGRGRRILKMWVRTNGLGHKEGALQGWLA